MIFDSNQIYGHCWAWDTKQPPHFASFKASHAVRADTLKLDENVNLLCGNFSIHLYNLSTENVVCQVYNMLPTIRATHVSQRIHKTKCNVKLSIELIWGFAKKRGIVKFANGINLLDCLVCMLSYYVLRVFLLPLGNPLKWPYYFIHIASVFLLALGKLSSKLTHKIVYNAM